MRLTEKQERRIARYLRDVNQFLAELSDKAREQALAALRQRIVTSLSGLPRQPVQDVDLEAVLAKYGDPARLAKQLVAQRQAPRRAGLPTQDVRWLGVCAGLARVLEVEPAVVRAFALILGITGPFALGLYLLGYFILYFAIPNPDAPRIQVGKLLQTVLVPVAITIFLFVFSVILIKGAMYAYLRFLAPGGSTLGEWTWLREDGASIFTWLLVVIIPLSILGGLPMANDWDATLKKVVQALVAIYAIVICLGIACLLVGIILNVVKGLALP
ncbi:MAG: PspC domain-containing protein [Candidatus Hydrogenedentes bacterium]|nr:PspC domain-containing protein [Candidatus Hydrogenedentota bacterium]